MAWWQQILSMFILVISSLGMIYVAAKIYRIGILTQGKKITFKEIGKWILILKKSFTFYLQLITFS